MQVAPSAHCVTHAQTYRPCAPAPAPAALQGYFHGDIKLDNVFRSRSTGTRLGDFGLCHKLRTAVIPCSFDAPNMDFGLIPGGLRGATPAMLSEVTT